ncbi:unnamed protein product [Pleuronectes platessa]|uniref:Uncharacterized protein n=1 Tax=Pleuronectes platessa TaxID=8262 RepID=A0A9N7THH6_PLEPL|nr:unnamed protein product [Pleuronectes platessa]
MAVGKWIEEVSRGGVLGNLLQRVIYEWAPAKLWPLYICLLVSPSSSPTLLLSNHFHHSRVKSGGKQDLVFDGQVLSADISPRQMSNKYRKRNAEGESEHRKERSNSVQSELEVSGSVSDSDLG